MFGQNGFQKKIRTIILTKKPTLSTFMNDLTQSRWLPIVLLTLSNIFMTFALAFDGLHYNMVKTFNSLL